MKSSGCTMRHLLLTGVDYNEWNAKGFGLREVAYMDGDWTDVVNMGFTPKHIMVRQRNGPTILRAAPFEVDWDTLEQDLGLTLDEAVFDHHFSTADFQMFGETLADLCGKRGFTREHAEAMGEPPTNFQLALSATETDLRIFFPEHQVVHRSAAPQHGASSRPFSKLNHLSATTSQPLVPHERGTDALVGANLKSGQTALGTQKEQRAYSKINQEKANASIPAPHVKKCKDFVF